MEMNMTKKNSIMKLMTVLLMMAVAISCMAGCGSTHTAGSYQPPAHYEGNDNTEPVTTVEPETEVPVEDSEAEIPVDEAQQLDDSDGEPEKPAEPMDSVEAVAAIGDFVGNYSQFTMLHESVVDIDNSHNPYDLTWAYGEKPEKDMPKDEKIALLKSAEWNAPYNAYVDLCDWSLVFDVDYYMDQFPVLAFLYQYDEDLLLEHFQTTGVHEGRQGSENFNVAAYMANCDQELVNAFGSSYECYYFYWMLNQDTENTVVTTDANAPVYLDVQLSYYQLEELNHINEYREEVGIAPVVPEPELMAFASWRAWYDAKNAVKAHDSINNPETKQCMLMMDITFYSENTTKYQWPNSKSHDELRTPYIAYRNSQDHYKAMVDDMYIYTGVTNTYLSEYTARTLTQFDLYTNYTPLTSR